MWAGVPVHTERWRWAEHLHRTPSAFWLQVHCGVPPCVSAAMLFSLWQTIAQSPYNLPAWNSFSQVFSHGNRKVTDTWHNQTAYGLQTPQPTLCAPAGSSYQHLSLLRCYSSHIFLSPHLAQFKLSNQILWTWTTDISFLVALWAASQGDIPAGFDSWWGLFSWGVKFQSLAVPLCVLSSGYTHKRDSPLFLLPIKTPTIPPQDPILTTLLSSKASWQSADSHTGTWGFNV